MAFILPHEVEELANQLLVQQMKGVSVDSIGDKDFDDDGQVIFNPPAVRTRFVAAGYTALHDNLALSYDSQSVLEIWCLDSDLSSKVNQRVASLKLAGKVMTVIVGARLRRDWDPVVLAKVDPWPAAIAGMAYVVSLVVPGIAQFPGINDPSVSA